MRWGPIESIMRLSTSSSSSRTTHHLLAALQLLYVLRIKPIFQAVLPLPPPIPHFPSSSYLSPPFSLSLSSPYSSSQLWKAKKKNIIGRWESGASETHEAALGSRDTQRQRWLSSGNLFAGVTHGASAAKRRGKQKQKREKKDDGRRKGKTRKKVPRSSLRLLCSYIYELASSIYTPSKTLKYIGHILRKKEPTFKKNIKKKKTSETLRKAEWLNEGKKRGGCE